MNIWPETVQSEYMDNNKIKKIFEYLAYRSKYVSTIWGSMRILKKKENSIGTDHKISVGSKCDNHKIIIHIIHHAVPGKANV